MGLTSKIIFLVLLISLTSNFCSGIADKDSLKQVIIEDVILTNLGDFLSNDIIQNHSSFFEEILKKTKTELIAINKISVFPVGLNDSESEVKLDYCIAKFQLIPKRNKVYNLICVLDENLQFIAARKFLYLKKVNIDTKKRVVSDVYGAPKKSIFRVVYYDKNLARNAPQKINRTEFYVIVGGEIVLLKKQLLFSSYY
jgi:hypothetical protein